MFQAGGSTNPYFYINAEGNKEFLSADGLKNDLQTIDSTTLKALIQNPDVTYSPATQELFRQVVAERKAPISSIDPSMFEFGAMLPDFFSLKQGAGELGRFIGGGLGTFAETGINLGRYLAQGLSERTPEQPEFKPIDYFPSEIFPFYPETVSGQSPFGERMINYDALLRQGLTNDRLDKVLGRSVLDFSEDIAELEKEPVVTEGTEEDVVEQAPSIPTPITGGETLGRSSDIDIARRQIEFEKSMIGRDEFGELLPDRPDFTSQLPSPERTEPVDLPPAVENEIQNALDELEGMTVPELVPETKPSVTFEKPKIDLQNVDTEITIDDLNRERASQLPPKETSGVFGSDRFLDFIRNVGGELARTGQLGEGLASGAAKAAEERAARDLLQEEEARKFEDAKKLLQIEAGLTGDEELSVSDLDKITSKEDELSTNLRNFQKSENTLSNLNYVIQTLDQGGATGLKGFFGEATDIVEAAIKSDTGKSFEELNPRTRANALLKVLRQANVREILGESGKTISNLDRQIVEDVFGDIKIGTPVSVSLKKLEDSRSRIINGMEESKNKITSAKTFFDRVQFNSAVYNSNLNLINRINNFDFNNALQFIKSQGISPNTSITDISLDPNAVI